MRSRSCSCPAGSREAASARSSSSRSSRPSPRSRPRSSFATRPCPCGFLAVVYPQGVSSDAVTAISFVSLEFWIGLPGMLFDRTFGIAGVAPWLFIVVIGIPAALRASRRVFAPAAITLGLSLVGLSLYHYWEGGYAPSARYFVDVLPLAAPFVAYGLAVTR